MIGRLPKRPRSITSLYMWGALLLFVLVSLMTLLAIYSEYREFDLRARELRRHYLQEQKARIAYDTDRVLGFIRSEYRKHHGEIATQTLQSQIKSAIEELYGRPDGTGYIFIYDFNGTCLSDPVQRQNVGKNLYGFRDPNGVQVIRDLIRVAQQPGGGYVRYTWLKPTTQRPSPKISYARAFKPWSWMVGTGVYLDEVDREIARRREALREKTLRNILKIILLTGALFIVGWLGVLWLNRIIRREVERFNGYFERAAKSHLQIEEDQVGLEEFRTLARYVNEMLRGIHRRKKRLQELNLSLEEKVAEQTADLRERNRMLQEEKAAKESLIQAQDSFIRQSIHEINTPLAVIMTHIDIFKMKYGQNRYLAKIEAASKMIATIYDDLSYMVKKNRIRVRRDPVDFSDFLRERIFFFQEIAEGNRLSIEPHIQEGIMICFGALQLQRIVDNNLSNAIKYARAESYIAVSLHREGEEIVLEFVTRSRQPIEDTRRIFEAWHREDEESEGFGLGLVIVREICEENGVKVEVSSDEERTVFRYRFEAEEECPKEEGDDENPAA